MPNAKTCKRLLSLSVTIVFFSSPLFAQQKRPAAPRKPAAQAPAPAARPAPVPTFDTLIAADSYRVYSEVRGVGQLIRSPAVTDLLDPVMNLGSPPKEFKTILKWLNANAEALAGSRMLAASWPVQPKLPAVLIAIEFASAEEAQKFDPKLRRFIPTLLPTPTPAPPPEDSTGPAVVGSPPSPTPVPDRGPVPPPFHIKQSGTLILITEKPFALKDLRPRGSTLLSEDQNFATARNRFASESIFVYIDTKSIQKEQEEQYKNREEEQKKRELEAANRPPPEETPSEEELQLMTRVEPPPMPEASPQAELVTTQPPAGEPTLTARASDGPTFSPGPDLSIFSLSSLLFGGQSGQSTWPEAVGVAVNFEDDAYVLRTLLINGADNKGGAIPFVPQFVSGPALIPESPGIFPADTDFFVAASLDYPGVYESLLKAFAGAHEMAQKYGGRPASVTPPESPFAFYEKKMGLKIKDDLLPLLGNEIALALSKSSPEVKVENPQPTEATPENSEKKSPAPTPPDPSPVIAISIKDRDAVRRLIPTIIESFGLKGASLLAQTEKRDDTEITSYAGVFTYAFLGNFLVLSTDPAAVRNTVNSFLNHQTLSSDSNFRNTIRWQPRRLLGQVYVAPDLVERYYPTGLMGAPANERMRDLLSRLSPVLDPVSYSLTDDGLGPLHELHVPRNMLTLMVAGISMESSQPPLIANQSAAKGVLRTVVNAEETFKSTRDDGRYGTLDELTAAGLFDKSWLQTYGYKLELTVSGNRFEATAVPVEYGKTGLLSFFIDETAVLRGADHGGGAATIADSPVQ